MINQYPFNAYVSPDKIIDLCFEGIYNVIVEVKESGKRLAFLHTATFNIQLAQMTMDFLVSIFPNDSLYIYKREADTIVKLNERVVEREDPGFLMTL